MSKLRNLIEQGPSLAGAKYPEQWAFPLLAAFDADRLKKTNVFDLKDGQSIDDRLDVLNGLYMAKGAVREKVHYWICLLHLAAHSYAIKKGRSDLEDSRNKLSGYLATKEGQFPEIASVYSVADASTEGQWS